MSDKSPEAEMTLEDLRTTMESALSSCEREVRGRLRGLKALTAHIPGVPDTCDANVVTAVNAIVDAEKAYTQVATTLDLMEAMEANRRARAEGVRAGVETIASDSDVNRKLAADITAMLGLMPEVKN
jgi:hypothetical protein